MRLEGKAAIITGGCSGLGLAATKEFLAQGCRVAIIDLNKERGMALQQELGPQVAFFSADVTNEDEVKRAFNEAFNKFKEIRVFLLCAGMAKVGRMISPKGELHSKALFKELINVNLTGTFLCAKYAAHHLKNLKLEAVERGVIITVASNLGIDGNKHYIAYGASKAAIMGMIMPMARDLGRYGVRVLSIAPGLIKTPMTGMMKQKGLRFVAQQTALGRLQIPQQFAHLTRVLAENSFINGTTIRADGGFANPHL